MTTAAAGTVCNLQFETATAAANTGQLSPIPAAHMPLLRCSLVLTRADPC
jgi:hypothetical protein